MSVSNVNRKNCYTSLVEFLLARIAHISWNCSVVYYLLLCWVLCFLAQWRLYHTLLLLWDSCLREVIDSCIHLLATARRFSKADNNIAIVPNDPLTVKWLNPLFQELPKTTNFIVSIVKHVLWCKNNEIFHQELENLISDLCTADCLRLSGF